MKLHFQANFQRTWMAPFRQSIEGPYHKVNDNTINWTLGGTTYCHFEKALQEKPFHVEQIGLYLYRNFQIKKISLFITFAVCDWPQKG
jgi:hypothetical protein